MKCVSEYRLLGDSDVATDDATDGHDRRFLTPQYHHGLITGIINLGQKKRFSLRQPGSQDTVKTIGKQHVCIHFISTGITGHT